MKETITQKTSLRENCRFGNRLFRVQVSVIDLDPKPVHRIGTWVKRKEEWLEAYFDSLNTT